LIEYQSAHDCTKNKLTYRFDQPSLLAIKRIPGGPGRCEGTPASTGLRRDLPRALALREAKHLVPHPGVYRLGLFQTRPRLVVCEQPQSRRGRKPPVCQQSHVRLVPAYGDVLRLLDYPALVGLMLRLLSPRHGLNTGRGDKRLEKDLEKAEPHRDVAVRLS
jgi:hypothetical protein